MAETGQKLDKIRDLSDFCARWGDLQKFVSEKALEEADLTEEARRIIDWMRILTEKTCALEH